MIKVGIINVTGYGGSELARILYNHSGVEIVSATGRSMAGKKLNQVFPHLYDIDIDISESITGQCDVIFSALPHTASAEVIKNYINEDVKIIDLSADFRLNDILDYNKWYEPNHPLENYLSKFTYGLTELYRDEIVNSNYVALPGCFPTSTLLALAPVLRNNLINPPLIIDSKTGVSGAGRKLSLNTHFSEINENVKAYSVYGHRHISEIIQESNLIDNRFDNQITFLPHLVPMTRGILTTIYADYNADKIKGNDHLIEIFRDFYKDSPFIKIVNEPPATKNTLGSNYCHIYPYIEPNSDKLILLSCIDNLVKGTAGQGVQNMNLMFGLNETESLIDLALYP